MARKPDAAVSGGALKSLGFERCNDDPGLGAAVSRKLFGRTLFKIDPSRVANKYIGETEKRLELALEAAAQTGAVLVLDEGDALLSRRTEVKDSRDRYANLEIAYLLQRVEEFGGVVMLATNMKQAADNAFIRRLRFVIDLS